MKLKTSNQKCTYFAPKSLIDKFYKSYISFLRLDGDPNALAKAKQSLTMKL